MQLLRAQEHLGSSPSARTSSGARNRPTSVWTSPSRASPRKEVRLAHEPRHEAVDSGAGRSSRGSDLLDAAGAHDGHAVADLEGLGLVVGDEQRRGTGGAEDVAHLAPQLGTERGVEAAERLVEQDERRVRRQRACQGDALLLATRELVRHPPLQAGEAGQRDELRNARGAPGRSRPKPMLAATSRWGNNADSWNTMPIAPALGWIVASRAGHRAPGDLDAAAVGTLEAGDEPQERRLPAP